MNPLYGSKPASELREGIDMVEVGEHFELARNVSRVSSHLTRVATPRRVLYFSDTEQVRFMERHYAHELASEALESLLRVKEQARGVSS